MALMPDIQATKRVVFEHRLGPWKGLWQITGTTDDFLKGIAVPGLSEPFSALPDHRLTQAGLVAARRSYLLYREIVQPERAFDPRQQ